MLCNRSESIILGKILAQKQNSDRDAKNFFTSTSFEECCTTQFIFYSSVDINKQNALTEPLFTVFSVTKISTMEENSSGGGRNEVSVVAAEHFAIHAGMYGLAPPSTGAMMPASPQQSGPTSRQHKHSAPQSRDEPPQDDADFLSSPHRECTILLLNCYSFLNTFEIGI